MCQRVGGRSLRVVHCARSGPRWSPHGLPGLPSASHLEIAFCATLFQAACTMQASWRTTSTPATRAQRVFACLGFLWRHCAWRRSLASGWMDMPHCVQMRTRAPMTGWCISSVQHWRCLRSYSSSCETPARLGWVKESCRSCGLALGGCLPSRTTPSAGLTRSFALRCAKET